MQENTVKQEPKLSGDASTPTNSTPEVGEELSKVAANPKRNILVMASMVTGFVVMGYNLLAPIFFSQNKDDANNVSVPIPKNVSTPSNVAADLPPIPQVPEPPKLVAPTPPPAPLVAEEVAPPLPPAAPLPVEPTVAPPVNASQVKSSFNASDDAAKQRAESKRKSSIVLVGGAPPKDQSAIAKEQENDFKKRGDLEYVLGQGKLIDAVVESAINSDFPGEIRAVVVRDVYSENSKVILIPKGTRVFGTFQTGDMNGRVTVTWNKINLESGYTLTIASNAVDNLGRIGVQGRVDNKYAEQMTNAVLTSAFSVAVASGLDKIIPPVASTATASQTASGVSSVISQATTIAADPNTQDPQTYTVVQIPAGGNDAGARAKIEAICALKSLITDVTSSTYLQMTTACTTAQATAANPANAAGGLGVLLTSLTGLATTSAQAAAANATPSQTQQASKQAFTDITTAAQNMIGQVQFKPTVTINQGTKIKIYVNKDYVFPKDAVNKTKVIH